MFEMSYSIKTTIFYLGFTIILYKIRLFRDIQIYFLYGVHGPIKCKNADEKFFNIKHQNWKWTEKKNCKGNNLKEDCQIVFKSNNIRYNQNIKILYLSSIQHFVKTSKI